MGRIATPHRELGMARPIEHVLTWGFNVLDMCWKKTSILTKDHLHKMDV